jgi:hypothetical protein
MSRKANNQIGTNWCGTEVPFITRMAPEPGRRPPWRQRDRCGEVRDRGRRSAAYVREAASAVERVPRGACTVRRLGRRPVVASRVSLTHPLTRSFFDGHALTQMSQKWPYLLVSTLHHGAGGPRIYPTGFARRGGEPEWLTDAGDASHHAAEHLRLSRMCLAGRRG